MRLQRSRGTVRSATIFVAWFLLLPAQFAQVPRELNAAVQGLASADPLARAQAFYALLQREASNIGTGRFIARVATARLLREQSEQADRIKVALIGALERENAYVQNSQKSNKRLTETYTNYYGDLIGSVASLHDIRSLNGLLNAITTGGMATDGLADLGAPAVSRIIAKLQDSNVLVREGAARALGKFLQRPQFAQDQNAVAQARRGLIRALGDTSPFVRIAAVDSIVAIRNLPEVKRKLENMAAKDPYRSKTVPSVLFPVQEAAKHALATSDYWVIRANTSFQCRIQAGDESPLGERYLGPYATRAEAKKDMCSHYDDTMSDPTKCWDLYPKDACK